MRSFFCPISGLRPVYFAVLSDDMKSGYVSEVWPDAFHMECSRRHYGRFCQTVIGRYETAEEACTAVCEALVPQTRRH